MILEQLLSFMLVLLREKRSIQTEMKTVAVESRKGAGPGPTGSRRFPFPAHQTGRAQLEHPAFRLVSPQRPRKCSDKTAPCDGTPDTFFALRPQLDWDHSEPQGPS